MRTQIALICQRVHAWHVKKDPTVSSVFDDTALLDVNQPNERTLIYIHHPFLRTIEAWLCEIPSANKTRVVEDHLWINLMLKISTKVVNLLSVPSVESLSESPKQLEFSDSSSDSDLSSSLSTSGNAAAISFKLKLSISNTVEVHHLHTKQINGLRSWKWLLHWLWFLQAIFWCYLPSMLTFWHYWINKIKMKHLHFRWTPRMCLRTLDRNVDE